MGNLEILASYSFHLIFAELPHFFNILSLPREVRSVSHVSVNIQRLVVINKRFSFLCLY